MIYDYVCDTCGDEAQVVCSVREMRDHLPCECGQQMRRRLSAPRVIPDIQPYRSAVTGERIRGRAHHKNHLREHGLIEVGDEPIKPRKPDPLPAVGPDIKQAIEELKAR